MIDIRRTPAWLLGLVIAVGSLTCKSDISDPNPQPAALVKRGGDGQVGLVNQQLAESLVVVVEDDQGSPLSGVTVQWSVGGGGSVDRAQVPSGLDGKSAVVRVLGNAAGVLTTTAAASGLPAVVFTSTAEAGSLPNLTIAVQPSSAAVNAVPLDRQPVIQVEDGTGQPAGAGVAVTAAVAGATLAGDAVVESDETGLVRFTDLELSGPDGSYTVVFSAPGYVSVQSSPIALTATPVESESPGDHHPALEPGGKRRGARPAAGRARRGSVGRPTRRGHHGHGIGRWRHPLRHGQCRDQREWRCHLHQPRPQRSIGQLHPGLLRHRPHQRRVERDHAADHRERDGAVDRTDHVAHCGHS